MSDLKLTSVDSAIIVLLGFEFLLTFVSAYAANSFSFLTHVAVAVAAYFLVRVSLQKPFPIAAFLGSVSAVSVYIALSSFNQLGRSVEKLAEYGLTNLVALRAQLFVPVQGWVPGEGFTALLLMLPISCAPAVYLWRSGRSTFAGIVICFAPTLILGVLCLSFSRAVAGAAVIFVLSMCILMIAYGVVIRKVGAILMCSALGWLLLILICESLWYPNVSAAYLGRHTSQVRSTQGRVEIWHRSLALVREHPVTGVGPSNAGLFLLSSNSADETTGFAGRAFSLPIQVLVEQGIAGFVLYSVLVIAAAFEFHRTMRCKTADAGDLETGRKRKQKQILLADRRMAAHKAMKCCFAAGILAVLFRELTYSSLLEHTLTLVMMFVLIALACGEVS